jgi:hypothetical protein
MGFAIGRWYRSYFLINGSGEVNVPGTNRYKDARDLDAVESTDHRVLQDIFVPHDHWCS